MKAIGIILIVVGIAMLAIRGFNVTSEKKVIDAGPLEVKKEENRWVGWPVYTGAVAVIAGLILVVADRRKSTSV